MALQSSPPRVRPDLSYRPRPSKLMQNPVVKHDPSGTNVDIVAEAEGSCSGPGPTTIMRLRNADNSRTVEATVERSVNARGQLTTTQVQVEVPPLQAVDLGCAVDPDPAGGKPRSITDWRVVSSRYR